MRVSAILAAAVAAVAVEAQINGFNYGTTFTDGAAKVQADFEAEFNRAKSLAGTHGRFTSARLYTMIQAGTTNTPVSAIPAAINTQTRLLLGLWASAGQGDFDNELAALSSAIHQYGTAFTDLIDGISVGSEDLYRNSPTGIANNHNLNEGAQPSTIVDFIGQTRKLIAGTAAAGAKVGHVDTWTAWVNGSNFAVTSACDWLGMDAYPYFQTTVDNSITLANSTFYDALDATIADAQGKPVWVTETGWPVSGSTLNQAVASIPNAETYWQEVQCSLHASRNMWWYTLQDAAPTTPNPSFGIVGSSLSGAPLYNLACRNAPSSAAASSAAPSSTAAAAHTAASATAPASSGSAAPNTESLSAAAPGPQTSPTGLGSSAVHQTSAAAGTTVSPVSSATTTVVGGRTHTIYTTTLVTITSCPSECTATSTTRMPPPSSAPAPTTSAAPAPSRSSCPANLQGSYQYPHLIVPVNSQQPTKAYGTQYNGTITPTISSIFNFDIPPSYAGQTCSLVFLFPTRSELQTSSFDFNGKGGISVDELSRPATRQTTYDTVPAAAVAGIGAIPHVQPGNSYVVASHPCAAGKTQSFEFKSTGGLDLMFFEDYNPSPLGAYITSC